MDMQPLSLGLRALELQALRDAHQFDAVEMAEEIVVPPRAAEFAVGHRLQADRFLPGHELGDLGILDRLQPGRRDLAGRAFGARLLDRRAAQQAADLVGAERGFGTLHFRLLLSGRYRGGVNSTLSGAFFIADARLESRVPG